MIIVMMLSCLASACTIVYDNIQPSLQLSLEIDNLFMTLINSLPKPWQGEQTSGFAVLSLESLTKNTF